MGLKHRKTTGALTSYQFMVLKDLHAGLSATDIATKRDVRPQGISDEVALIRAKFDVYTTAQAVAQYARYLELERVSDQLWEACTGHPDDEHVDHVLKGLAALFSDRAEKLMPRDN